MLHAPPNRDFVDRLLNRAVNNVQPHGCLLLLSNAMHTRNGLQLNGGIDEWLTKKHMRGIGEVEARGVCAGVEEKDLGGRVLLEVGGTVGLVEGGEADAVAAEG